MPNRSTWGQVELDEGDRRTRHEHDAVERRPPLDSARRRDPHRLLTELASVIGRKWHLVIVHELVGGPQGFGALKTRIDGISSKVLTNHLRDLEEKGLVERTVVSDRPFRVEYSLTGRGRSFRELIDPVLEGTVSLR